MRYIPRSRALDSPQRDALGLMLSQSVLRSTLRTLIVATGMWAFCVLIFGGFTVQWGWFRLASRDATRALLLIALLIAVYVRVVGLAQARPELSRIRIAAARRAPLLAAATSLFVLVVAIQHGTFVASGADTYGYVSEAELWEKGNLHVAQPLAMVLPWPIPLQTLTPLGYVPGPSRRDVVPAYPPGLPLVMVAFRAVLGPQGQYYVCPVLGALAVWLTFVLGRRVTGRSSIGLAAALILATSPPFLFVLMPPLSDVPATAVWTLAIILALSPSVVAALASGAAAGVAVLIRPNLSPAAIVLAVAVLWSSIRSRGIAWKALIPPVAFVAAILPGVIVLALFNRSLYGSAFASGYGDPRLLYSFGYLRTNAVQFVAWMFESRSAYALLGTAAALVLWPRSIARTCPGASTRLLFGGFTAVIWLSYLFYHPFDTWWWLRFLLPMWPVTIVLAAALAADVLGCLEVPSGGVVLAALAVVIFVHGYRTSDAKGVFQLQKQEARCTDAAAWVRRNTDEKAVFVAGEHSGMLRYYTGRTTVRFEFLDASWLDRGIVFLSGLGHHAYIVLEPYEEELFRKRFGSTNALGRLDWAPVPGMSGVRIYDTQPLLASAPFTY
jgi:hypothetical protein